MEPFVEKRITGTFYKEKWMDSRCNDSVVCDQESFDATCQILLLDHKKLIELVNYSTEVDEIGLKHVSWDGPFYIGGIEESVCEFFGVDYLGEISPKDLFDAQERIQPQEPILKEVTFKVTVKVVLLPDVLGANLDNFTKNVEFSVKSKTPGVIIQHVDLESVKLTKPLVLKDSLTCP